MNLLPPLPGVCCILGQLLGSKGISRSQGLLKPFAIPASWLVCFVLLLLANCCSGDTSSLVVVLLMDLTHKLSRN